MMVMLMEMETEAGTTGKKIKTKPKKTKKQPKRSSTPKHQMRKKKAK